MEKTGKPTPQGGKTAQEGQEFPDHDQIALNAQDELAAHMATKMAASRAAEADTALLPALTQPKKD